MIDNIVLAEEMVTAWHWFDIAGFMWKVAFAKAYNSIDWRFLWNVLRQHSFPEEWVQWVKLCVTTTSFSVLVNGWPQGEWFQPQRDLRQGCLLAQRLFILVVDALAIFIRRLCSQGYLSGFQTAGTPEEILLPQYADNTTFYIRGSEVVAYTLSSIMDIFFDCSRLQLNRAKSIFMGFWLSTEEE